MILNARGVSWQFFGNMNAGECSISQSAGLMGTFNSVTSQLRNLNHHPRLIITAELFLSPGALEL